MNLVKTRLMYGKIYQVGLHLILNNGMHCPASSYHAVEQN